MELDEKLRWLETRISSSLKPRNEELKMLFTNEENRLAFHEFINNEDVKRLFVFARQPKQIVASLQPPHDLKAKSIFFLKNNAGVKLTKDNMSKEVSYLDSSGEALQHIELLTREVYLPLLCTDQMNATSYGVSADRLMDVLHRLMAAVEVTQGHTHGEVVLPLPSIEVLAEAAASVNRRGAVLHVLESTVIGWIKQIKGVLKHDPLVDIWRLYGNNPGPADEMELWETRLDKLHSINTQLASPIAKDILRNLEEAQSTYAQSFQFVRKDISKALSNTEDNLKYLRVLMRWVEELRGAANPREILKVLPPIMHTVMLVWSHSRYYHQPDKFHNLMRLMSNEIVHRAENMVGADVLREPLESHGKLKDALRVCAAFRGTYLDYKDKADAANDHNKQEHAEKISSHPQGGVLFSTKLYGPHAYTPRYGLKSRDGSEAAQLLAEEELWTHSPWPPRNAPCFNLLNSFMERCNDVLELVQTTQHFRLLADAAEVGGAGSQSLDALVKEIHVKYTEAMDAFFDKVDNILSIDGTQAFEHAFFTFRTVVKELEERLAGVLRQSFHQCPTIAAQLRLLEVFEGVSGRELVQHHLRDKDRELIQAFTDELVQIRGVFQLMQKYPPLHKNMPPVVGKLMWVYGLKARIQGPMKKLKRVSPHSLEGDLGWQLREAYSEIIEEFQRYEDQIILQWQNNLTAELTSRLKQPLLITDDLISEEDEERPQVVHVNLDPQLLLLLREIHYLGQEPFNIKLPGPARELIRNTNSYDLRVTATRLETIVSKYNTVMRTMTDFERPLFERKLEKIDMLFQDGLTQYTWRTEESADFIETATALVCLDLHRNLDIVQTNCTEIAEITLSWSRGTLDIFAAREPEKSYSVDDLINLQNKLNEDHETYVVPSGGKAHALLGSSFEAVQISEASPAWQDYMDYVDAIVLEGLKQASLTSLRNMLNQIIKANMTEDEVIPILTIRVELIENEVSFRPPLDQSTSVTSVQETVQQWLDSFLARGKLVKVLGGEGDYLQFISQDEEVRQLVDNINKLVRENGEECKKLCDIFKDYSFLWMQDVNETFEAFLRGNLSPNPLRTSQSSKAAYLQAMPSDRSLIQSRVSSGKSSASSVHSLGQAERTFLTPKQSQQTAPSVPSLDEFDTEINIYRTARDDIQGLTDFHDEGWLRVDLQPLKQVLTTYACKWMWTFTKYLSDQVTNTLEALDRFMKRIEPEIESITGEERDTASFMKMMRLFNEVSAQQAEMDGKFVAMHKTVVLVKKYGYKLTTSTQQLFDAAPSRWNSLKTKVSLAKQRLGPRIQEESDRITKDLAAFGQRVNALHDELDHSEVYSRDCTIEDAWQAIDSFVRRLSVLENEAQDLIELQELLEASVVDFSLIPQCRHDLTNLKQLWETVRIIQDQQGEWKRHRWQKINTKFLRDETTRQLEVVRALPEDVFSWDVYMGLQEAITTIQACLPLIDDLSNPAMRTRHWKQLVRVTGGAVQVDNDTLRRMTLGELLGLGLQKHVDDVRAIVQRAVKDLSIEQSLKTYEEVWLSKIFELRLHVRSKSKSVVEPAQPAQPDNTDNQSEMSQDGAASHPPASTLSRSHVRTTSRVSNQSSNRNRRTSVSSLPASLLNLGEDTGLLYLLSKTDMIFEELESHQVTLQAMQGSSAAGSFLDEVLKWQKRLQTIEGVMSVWLDVQEKWVELEEVYTNTDVKMTLAHEYSLFSSVNRDFRLLMRATEKNPNVLQCCSRKNILTIMEKMNSNLEHCRKSLLNHLERRRQKFPRFYFLSMEDVLHIVCNGYDINQVNIYINKLFENIGCLMFEELEESERCHFQLIGVQSMLGEKLFFQQPVLCEGHIEIWLSAFLSALKGALQFQLATAMGIEKPVKRQREIHSAGARRVAVPGSRAGSSARPGTREKPSSRSGMSSRGASRHSSRAGRIEDAPPQSTRELPEAPHSWMLDHVSEIVHLSTQIQMTQQITEALNEMQQGNQSALQVAMEKVEESLQATVMMLKGIEDQKEAQLKRQKQKLQSDSEAQSQRENNSDTQSFLGKGSKPASVRGSTYDLTVEQQATIPEETSSRRDDGSATAEPVSTQPVDTMNIGFEPLVVKKENTVIEEAEEESSEVKLLLFPSQIQKISTLVGLMGHQRDVLRRLQDTVTSGQTGVDADLFDWKAQMRYSFDAESRNATVQCLDSTFDYGFEYMGSCSREVITPQTERAFLTLTQAVQSHYGGLVMGRQSIGKLSLVHELSRCLGQPFYNFNCTQNTDSYVLQDIFRGVANTGCWICFNNVNNMGAAVLSVCAQLLSSLLEALRAGKTAVTLQTEEVQLHPKAACFALISSGLKVAPGNPDKLLLFNSAMSALPTDFLQNFRTVSIVNPDLGLALEVLLLCQGFLNASEHSHKTMLLYDMCRKLIGTNSPIVQDTTHLVLGAGDLFHGFSMQTLKSVAAEAGLILETLVSNKVAAQVDEEILFEGENEEKHEKEDLEKGTKDLDKEQLNRLEDEAIVTSIRNIFLPRLMDRDASLFATIVQDLWPHVTVPMGFVSSSVNINERTSQLTARSKSKSHLEMRSFRDSLNLNTPVVDLSSLHDGFYVDPDQHKLNLEDINDSIAVATTSLGLMPGAAFQARVSQLAQLSISHKAIIVAGPAGCGKSECIKTFAISERERGKLITVQSVFTKAVESHELLGYLDPVRKEWKDGLIPFILRKFCVQPNNVTNDSSSTRPLMKILQLDGELDPQQMELTDTILHNDGSVVLSNNERIIISESLRFIWEVESLSSLSPSLLCNVGVVVMEPTDVGWQLMLAQWIENRPDGDRDLVRSLCDTYMETLMEHIVDCTKPPLQGGRQAGGKGPFYRRMIYQTQQNMLTTFTSLFESLVTPFPDLSDVEYERYFNFACIWAFAGTLEVRYRDAFSSWWKQQFEKYITYPPDGTVFDYFVDNESHEFVKWSDSLPAFSGTPHVGIPSDSFVHTITAEQIYYLLGLLSDFGKPVMLAGENGCGKTAIVNERIRTACSGEVAEVLALTISTNRFTNARLIYQRLGDRLEWKHGRTYVPRGNKRLMCLVDDLNLAQVDKFGCQTAVELVRQHIDDGGFYDPDSHAWRYVKNVTYVTTINPTPAAKVPKMSARFLRHFAILGVPYPSSAELQSVFTTLLHTHFITPEISTTVTMSSSAAHHLGIHDEKVRNVIRVEEEALRHLLALIVKVTLELQVRLRSMFLPTAQRCHYIFTLSDLGNIFRNLCLSLRPACNKDTLLLLWQHECQWVYGRRMVNEVDYDRFQQAFITAVRKEFINEDQISLMSSGERPIFSNLLEQDSGVVLAGNTQSRSNTNLSDEDAETDSYKPVFKVQRVRELMERGMEEYNKTHPPIKLALYRIVLEQVCRLARVIASPHEVAHSVLVAEGCSGRCSIIAQLAAHLCGYTVVKVSPMSTLSTTGQHLQHFQADLVAAYTRAGVKGEKLLMLIREEDLVEEDFLVFLTEFIVSGSISHLFSYEEATTIINSIRTEVTQAGLTYTRDVAWDFFLRTVRKNFRICLIANDSSLSLQRRCREFPAFTKNVNFLWFPHWSKKLLVKHAIYHLKEVVWMDRVQRENVAHMLANMHIVMRQQDGQELTTGQYRHITNTTYEKFIERFISLAKSRYDEIQEYHAAASAALEHIQKENTLATKLRKQLEHERVVLQERKAGTVKVLSQIGQDTAITEQQVKIVKAQLEKITRLKKLLPEYQVAHERAVYKAIAIVADTKKIVQSMDNASLQELRAMSKPIIDIEDLMAAIIMILKSPSADLTWQKGAKRLMANLERFSEELLTFDDQQLPEATLNLVEPYLKKASFEPDTLQRKTGNAACASLCRWVRGVVRYHRMMVSKVKPLHNKVEQTTQAVDNAEHKMMTLENKRKALEVRLADLARGFEEATIDKNNQEEKTIRMDKTLETVARLKKILKGEYLRCQQIYDSLPFRLSAVAGGVGMAAALVTYLGPYHYNFRRLMLTVHLPNCLRERGIPLLIDSINELKGRVVDWSIDGLKTASGASGTMVDYESLLTAGSQLGDIPEVDEEPDQDEEEMEEEKQDRGSEKMDEMKEDGEKRVEKEDEEEEETEEKKVEAEEVDGGKEVENRGEEEEEEETVAPPADEEEEDAEEDYYGDVDYSDFGSQNGSDVTGSSIPVITTTQYTQYIRSLVKLLVGEQQLLDWVQKDFGLRQLENAAILVSSWQRPPLLIDPYGEGALYLRKLNSILHERKIVSLDMENRSDPNVMVSVEKCILKGKGLLLNNCEEKMDAMVSPLVYHINSLSELNEEKESRLVTFLERRILCHADFRLYLQTSQPKPRLSPEIASLVTMINYGLSNETLVDDFLNRAFARLRPVLFTERNVALKSINQTKAGLLHISEFAKQQMFKAGKITVIKTGSASDIFPEKDVEVISEVTRKRVQMAQKIRTTEGALLELESLRDELFPLARRATLLYAIIRSLACVQREYQFTLAYFMKIFDEAVGGEFPTEFLEDPEKGVVYREDTSIESQHGSKSDAEESQPSNRTDAKKIKVEVTEETANIDCPTDTQSHAATTNPTSFTRKTSSKRSSRRSSSSSSSSSSSGSSSSDSSSSGSDSSDSDSSSDDDNDNNDGHQGDNYEDDFEDENKPNSPVPVAGDSDRVKSAGSKKNAKEEVKEDEEKIPIIDLPEAPDLPTPGVEYSKMPTEEIQRLIDNLTNRVYHEISRSLFEEHKLLFATMLCLNIQAEALNADNEQNIMDEELSLLLQGNPGLGMQLTLADFECDAEPPLWLPSEKWDDIMAISVLPGPLDSLCVHMATNTDQWKLWYRSEQPENEVLPIQSKSDEDEANNDEEEDIDGADLSDFHRLILIRMLRPDRLPTAMAQYVSSNLPHSLSQTEPLSTAALMKTVYDNHWGALVLLPAGATQTDVHTVSSIRMTMSASDVIRQLAQDQGVEVETIVIGSGNENRVTMAVDMADKEDSWVVLDRVHLASDQLLRNLRINLARIARSRESTNQSTDSKFCVWLTTEPSDRLPVEVVQNLYTVSWESLQSLITPAKSAATSEETSGSRELYYGSLEEVFSTAILSTLKSVPKSVWSRLDEQPQGCKRAIFGVVIIQAALVARQMFGTRGTNQWYPFSASQIEQAVDLILSPSLQNQSEDTLSAVVSKVVFGNVMCTEPDQEYMSILTSLVLGDLIGRDSDVVTLGSVEIPVPPASVSPGDYAQWFESQIDQLGSTTEALGLLGNVDRENNEAQSALFIRYLENLYESQNLDPGDIRVIAEPEADLYRLRTILDSVWEQLPSLLELGVVPQRLSEGDFNFPYHRPSVLSVATVESVLMPESIGFVLLQECQWLNSLLCHIRQNIFDLQQSILGGVDTIPSYLQKTMISLLDEHVPATWVHPNCQPSTHTLTSWQSDLKKRHQQMNSWVKRGMIPTFSADQKLVPPSSHGMLRSIWLGGLVNPQALFTALRQEKAVISDCLVDDVTLACDISDSYDISTFDAPDEGGLLLYDLYMQGGAWDKENNCLTLPKNNLTALPVMYVRPILKKDLNADVGEEQNKRSKVYSCPVYMNKARQVCVQTLPLNCPGSVDIWVMSGTAVMLDAGVPEDSAKKSRSLLVSKPPLVSARLSDSENLSQHASALALDLPVDTERDDSVVDEKSSQSQLSFRQMTPQAPPLPPELSMKRENQMMVKSDGDDHLQSKESVAQQSQRSKESNVSKQPKEPGSQRSSDTNGSKKSKQPDTKRSDDTNASKKSSKQSKGSDSQRSNETNASKKSKQPDSQRSSDTNASRKSKQSRDPDSQRSKISKDPQAGTVTTATKSSDPSKDKKKVSKAGSVNSPVNQSPRSDTSKASKKSNSPKTVKRATEPEDNVAGADRLSLKSDTKDDSSVKSAHITGGDTNNSNINSDRPASQNDQSDRPASRNNQSERPASRNNQSDSYKPQATEDSQGKTETPRPSAQSDNKKKSDVVEGGDDKHKESSDVDPLSVHDDGDVGQKNKDDLPSPADRPSSGQSRSARVSDMLNAGPKHGTRQDSAGSRRGFEPDY